MDIDETVNVMPDAIAMLTTEDTDQRNLKKGGDIEHHALSNVVAPPKKVKLEIENGQLVLRWTMPENFQYRCSYHVYVHLSKGDELVWQDYTEETEYTFPKEKYSPLKCYYAYVSAQVINSIHKSELRQSSKIRLCKQTKKGRFFYDPSHPLKKDHEVYIGYIKVIEDKVAVKVIGKQDSREIEHLIEFSKSPRENVVAYRDWDKTRYFPFNPCIAMELCDEDTLAEIIKKNLLKGKGHEVKKVMIHIMRGLSCIHEKNILHRDLKPHNILRSLDGTTIKISDFGLSKRMEDGQSMTAKSQSTCGTIGWGSPEHYGGTGELMSKKSDIFSTGLIYYYILSEGSCLYGDNIYEFISQRIKREPIILPPLHCEEPELATDLISKMLECEQKDRPDCNQVLAHPFFWSHETKIDFIHRVCSYVKRKLHEQEGASAITQEISSSLDEVDRDFYDWQDKMLKSDKEGAEFLANKAKNGKYSTASIKELIRFIRNIEEHYVGHPELVSLFKDTRANVWPYFSSIFPKLLPNLFNIFHKHLSGMDEIPELTDIKKYLMKQAAYERLELFEEMPSKKRKLQSV